MDQKLHRLCILLSTTNFLILAACSCFGDTRVATLVGLGQAQWALFLARFNFSLTHCPVTRNGKPDDVSHQFSPEMEDSGKETFISPTCVVGATMWRVEQEVQEALRDIPGPGEHSS